MELLGKAGGILIPTRAAPLVLIPLSPGGKHGDGRMKYALIDAADYERVKDFKWCAAWNRTSRSFYAQSSPPRTRGKTVQLARLILGLVPGDGIEADHANHATLDNRRPNLRAATPSRNRQNVHRRCDNASGFRGVHLHHNRPKRWARWAARIQSEGVERHLGYFKTAEAAGRAYDAAARELHGEFARVNFP